MYSYSALYGAVRLMVLQAARDRDCLLYGVVWRPYSMHTTTFRTAVPTANFTGIVQTALAMLARLPRPASGLRSSCRRPSHRSASSSRVQSVALDSYTESFESEGWDSVDALFDINESDLTCLISDVHIWAHTHTVPYITFTIQPRVQQKTDVWRHTTDNPCPALPVKPYSRTGPYRAIQGAVGIHYTAPTSYSAIHPPSAGSVRPVWYTTPV